ncbi:MAG: ATP-dependent 6-phosphofructokinase [Firmicutes bacterium]|nr:ATP-dependent 6-phosphofructokinase [Bacillota bacterium]
MNFAVLTGGGDSSGINDFLYFLAHRLEREGHSLIGFRRSWLGLVNDDVVPLDRAKLAESRFTSGTILGSARKNPIKDGEMDAVLASLESNKVDALIAMGGDDTLGVAGHLAKLGFNVVGVPQTIDDDVFGTDRTLGYYTAVNQAVSAVNSMVNSNVAHDRDMIVEIMGRDAGWLALATALNTPACACMCPEGPMHLEEMIASMQRYKKNTGKAGLAIVSEGIQLEGIVREGLARDAFGNLAYEGVSHIVADLYKEATGRNPRVQILGFLLRGGTPSPQDVELAANYANQAVDLALAGKTGHMVARKNGQAHAVPLADVVGTKKLVGLDYLTKQLELLA